MSISGSEPARPEPSNQSSRARSALRPLGGGDYVLSIAFEQRSLQQKWVATDLHERVWTQMEEHIDGFGLKPYTAV